MNAPYPPFPPFPAFPPFPPFPPYVVGGYPAGGAVAGCAGAGAPAAMTYSPPAGAPAQPPGPAPGPAPFPGSSAGSPLTIYFNYDSPALVDTTNEGVGSGQLAKLQLFAAHAQAARVTALTVNGYASPEGSTAHNATLAANRAGAVRDRLATLLSGVQITIGTTTELPGAQPTWPSLRRADVFVTAPVI